MSLLFLQVRVAAGDREYISSENGKPLFNPYLNNPNVIYKPYLESFTPSPSPAPTAGTPIKASKKILPELLHTELEKIGSPLAPYSDQILASDYWSTILGICAIEQYNCTRAPVNNYWGLLRNGKPIPYATLEQGIKAIDAFLQKAERNGRGTIESFRGWYCASACSNWEPVVKSKKMHYENLQ